MGRYVTNAEFKEINRLLNKKGKRSGCLGCLGLIFLALILLAVLSLLGQKGSENSSGTPAETVSSSAPAAPAETASEEKVRVKFTYPMREWVDSKGKKISARFVKFDGEKAVLFVAGGNERAISIEKFSEKDAAYLEAIKTFSAEIVPAAGAEEREWTYFSGRKPFSAVLLTATETLVLLKEKKRTELHCRQDLSVPDWKYLESMGY